MRGPAWKSTTTGSSPVLGHKINCSGAGTGIQGGLRNHLLRVRIPPGVQQIVGPLKVDIGSLIGQKDRSTGRLQKILELAYSKASGSKSEERIRKPALIYLSLKHKW